MSIANPSSGEFPAVAMIVVGARDPALVKMPGIRTVSLPLVPGPLLSLVRSLTFPARSVRWPERPQNGGAGTVGGPWVN